MQIRHVSIFTGDAVLPATLRLPDCAAPAPAVVFHNGYAAYQEMYDGMAAELCRNGYLTLQFDPRGTDGESRGRFLCGTQWLEDACAAVSYVCGLPQADASRVAFSGVSMGGGMTILQGAADPRLKCLFAMAPPANFGEQMHEAWVKNQGEAAWQAHLEHLFCDAARVAHGYPSERMEGAYACWGIELSKEEKAENRRTQPRVAHELTLSSVLNSYLYYDVRAAAARLRVPLCLVHGTADTTIAYHCSEELYAVTSAPVRELHLIPGKGHVLPEEACDEVTRLALDWFSKYL